MGVGPVFPSPRQDLVERDQPVVLGHLLTGFFSGALCFAAGAEGNGLAERIVPIRKPRV
jgi:hypothetical protein